MIFTSIIRSASTRQRKVALIFLVAGLVLIAMVFALTTNMRSATPHSGLAREIPQTSVEDSTMAALSAVKTKRFEAFALPIALTGIVATNDYTQGYAIIRSADRREASFKAEDSIFGLATLKEIHSDSVVIARAGQFETLYLSDGFEFPDTEEELARKAEATQIVSFYRNSFVNGDGMELTDSFDFDTAYRDGSFIGFTLVATGENGARMLDVLGLKDGDLITVVNGNRLGDSISAVQSLSALRDALEIDIEVERDGAPIRFHFDINSLESDPDDDELY